MGKFLNFIGLEDSEEEAIQEEQQPQQPAPRTKRKENQLVGGGTSQPMPSIPAMKMIVYHPVCYDDAQNIVDNLKSRKPVIVNMEELDGACAQRVLDFLLGAVYALDGTINKVSRGTSLAAPPDCDVVDNGDDSYREM